MTQFLSETRERFIVAIAEQVAADRIAEIHFFKPIKQGGLESGVAVVAIVPPPASESAQAEAPSLELPAEDPSPANESPKPAPVRHTVFSAQYRLTLKGLDRGKWQVNVVEEADAPLITVEMVVRGVQRRAGDVDDPERMEGDAVREVLEAAAARQEPHALSTKH
jgi:hypothetical protein